MPPPSGEGTVVLDVGGTMGALVILVTGALDGEEIEIRHAGGAWEGTHTAVRRRHLRDSVVFAGVFGSLPAGDYQARVRGGAPGQPGPATTVDLTVTGGEITQMDWPDACLPAGRPGRPS
jgi:hypothetical protein